MDHRSRLLSSADLEAGFSGGADAPSVVTSHNIRRRGSYRAIRSVPPPPPPPVAGFFCDDFSDDEPGHFLDACFLCKKSLAGNGDIYMYRGDTPFCSEECRQEQIEIDEAKERSKATATPAQRQIAARKQQSHVRTAAGTAVAG